MKTQLIFGFDIGTFSTKVSFKQMGQETNIITKEFPNLILFGELKQKYFCEDALKKIQESPEMNASNFSTNFVNLIQLSCQKSLSENETFHTFCQARATANHKVQLNLKRDGTAVSPEKCLSLFLNYIKLNLLKNFFQGVDLVSVFAIIGVNDQFNFFYPNILMQCFLKAGFLRPRILPASLPVALLYNKLHNFLTNKVVLLLDVGYSTIRLSLVKINSTETEILQSAELALGIRDFDMEVYVNVLSEMKSKYRIDYQKDKFIRFDFLSKMHTIRKTFSLNTSMVVNLQDTFGSRYFDQYFKLDQKKYNSFNSNNFQKFQTFVEVCFQDFCITKNIQIDDVQVIGGGSKIQKFVSIVQKKFESKHLTDKLSACYSGSYGAVLVDQTETKLVFRLPTNLRFQILQVDKEQVKSGGGLHSSQDESAGIPIKDNTSEGSQKNVQQQLVSFKKKVKESEIINESIKEIDSQMGSGKNVSSEFNLADQLTASVKLIDEGMIYNNNEPINSQKNEKTVSLRNTDSAKMYRLVICSSGINSSDNRILFKADIPFSNFQSFVFEIDQSLSVKPLLFLPENKKMEFVLHHCSSLETSKISQYESVVANRPEKNEIVFNLNFQEKSKCSCSHDDPTGNGKLKKHSLMNAAFLHIFGDLVQDVIMLGTGITLFFKPSWEIIDPILTIISSLFLIFIMGQFTYRLYARLMESVPGDINYQSVLAQLLQIANVVEIHDLHIWDLGNNKNAATAHIVANDNKDQVLKDATIVFRKHAVYHSTIQIESVNGKNQENYINCKNNIDS